MVAQVVAVDGSSKSCEERAEGEGSAVLAAIFPAKLVKMLKFN